MDLTLLFLEPASTLSPLPLVGISCESKTIADLASGLESAKGEYVLTVEPGNRLDVELFERMWKKRNEAEVVLASRYLRAGSKEPGHLPSPGVRFRNGLLRRALRLACYDVTSPVRLYRTSALRAITVASRDPSLPLELLVGLHNRGFKIREVAANEGVQRSHSSGHAQLAAIPRLRSARLSPEAADSDDIAFEGRFSWRRRWLERRQATIVSFLEVDVPVLDAGCGSSRLIQSLSRGIGLDKDRNKLRFLRGRAKATVAGDLMRLPFPDGSFRQVVCSDVIGELSSSGPYLSELRRILVPRGTLVVSAPAASAFARGATEAGLRRELEDNGFTVDTVRRVYRRELVVRAIRKPVLAL